jgi:choline-glycine betaine transporter
MVNMKDINFWRKLSNISAYSFGGFIIIFKFIINDSGSYYYLTMTIGIILVMLFLLSELMKFILRRKNN